MNYIDGAPCTDAEWLRAVDDEATDTSRIPDAATPAAPARSVASSPRLRFPPFMTLQAAARIADEHGLELVLSWDGKQACVTTRPKHEHQEMPAFLRRQCDPSGELS